MIVSNTSPLIFLGKTGRLHLLKDIFEEVIVPSSVQEEIRVKKSSPEMTAFNKCIRDEWMIVEETEASDLLESNALEKAEKEAITLASEKDCIVLLDDDQAKAYADIMGVEAHGTLYVLIKGRTQGLLSEEEAMQCLEDIMKEGFYISTQVYNQFKKYVS